MENRYLPERQSGRIGYLFDGSHPFLEAIALVAGCIAVVALLSEAFQ